MSEQFYDAVEEQVRFGGNYRSGWTSPERVKLLSRIGRTLFKRGAMTTGALAACLHITNGVNDETFQSALQALADWKYLELRKREWGNAYVAELTKTGSFIAFHECCDRQLQGKDALGE
jgi:hypothetical protein